MTRIEVFSAGCPLCEDAIRTVRETACPTCEITVHDLREGCETMECRDKASAYGVMRVPAVAVDGVLVPCCADTPVMPELLRQAGVGRP
ncbi:MAG: thioredoxin family protein [Fimbriimonadales bacterium]